MASNFTPGDIELHTYHFQFWHFRLPTSFSHHLQFHMWAPLITPPPPSNFPNQSQFHIWAPPIIYPISPPLPISHLGTSITHPIALWLLMSHLGTSHYLPTFPITSNFRCGQLQVIPTFLTTSNFSSGHHQLPMQFDTRAHVITHPLSPQLQISHLCTSDYPPSVPTTPNFKPGTSYYPPNNFTPGHFELPTPFPHHFQFHTRAPAMTPPFTQSPPISYLSTSNYPTNSTNTPNFKPGHIWLPTQCHHHSQLHTQFCHHTQCHIWGHPITHTLSPPLPISYLGTSNHPPAFQITSNFIPDHPQFDTGRIDPILNF